MTATDLAGVATMLPSSPANAGPSPATHSTAWHEERRTRIGGSDIACLLGLSRYASPWSLWAEKVGLTTPGEGDDTERLWIGREIEPFLARLFHRHTGLHIAGEQMMLRHPEHRHFGATADGFAVESEDSTIDDALGPVQFKTWGTYGWRDGVPAAIRAQVLWEMYVAQAERAWLGVLFAGFRFEVYPFELDDDARADIAFMASRAEWFWNLVQTQTPPPVDGSEATADAIAAVWPTHAADTTFDADQELIEILGHRAAIKARIRADQKVVDECDNEIAARIGDCEYVAVGGVPQWSYRSQERVTVDGKALASAHGLDAEPFTKRTQYRVLREMREKKK